MSNFYTIVVGSSFSSIPIINILKRLGHYVIVCGNNDSDPAINLCDEYINIDYSRSDLLFDAIKNKKFNFIVPTCNDFSYQTATIVANKYNLPGYDSEDTSSIIFNKKRYKKLLKENNINTPSFIEDSDITKFPFLVKPVDSFSGIGITKVLASKDLDAAISKAKTNSREVQCLYEEFIDGSLHSHSAFIEGGRIKKDYFVDEYCTNYAYQVNSSFFPSSIGLKLKNKIRKKVSKIVSVLNLSDGLFHTQYIIKKRNVYIIESMRRCPGDLFPELINKSLNTNYWEDYVNPFIGRNITEKQKPRKIKTIARHTISTDKKINLYNYSFDIDKYQKIDIYPLKENGAMLDFAPKDKAAIVFLEYKKGKGIEGLTSNFFKGLNFNI